MGIGLIGLGVMGRNLALNLRDAGQGPVVWDPWPAARDWRAEGIETAAAIEDLIAALTPPRSVLLLVKAGQPVTDLCAALRGRLAPGDRVVDGGNSFYRDSTARQAALAEAGLSFLGLGISGGAEGARHGPAMMAGGDEAAWRALAPLLEGIAARAGETPCAAYFGAGGAGHFVKMVHNGIEYAVMQAIAEACALLALAPGRSPAAVGEVLAGWSRGPLAGYLVEITAEIMATEDPRSGGPLIEVISDVAGHKGTGGWCVAAGLDYGVPIPAIAEAVALRQLSAQSDLRAALRAGDRAPTAGDLPGDRDVEAALDAAIRIALTQGLRLIAAAAREHSWPASPQASARVWRAGSILRMALLDEVGTDAADLLTDAAGRLRGLKRAVAAGLGHGLPLPAMASCLAYWNGLAAAQLPTAVIQAQRDRFGAHGFARRDAPGSHHGPWHEDEA